MVILDACLFVMLATRCTCYVQCMRNPWIVLCKVVIDMLCKNPWIAQQFCKLWIAVGVCSLQQNGSCFIQSIPANSCLLNMCFTSKWTYLASYYCYSYWSYLLLLQLLQQPTSFSYVQLYYSYIYLLLLYSYCSYLLQLRITIAPTYYNQLQLLQLPTIH